MSGGCEQINTSSWRLKMNTISKTVGIMLMASFVASFTAIGSGFAHNLEDHTITAPPVVAPVKPAWEAWDLKTVGLQLTALPMAVGVGAANFYLSGMVSDSYFEEKYPNADALERLDEKLAFWTASAVFGYTLSQGVLIGALGDAMGGDGGLVAPTAVGLLSMGIWGGALYLTDVSFKHYDLILPAMMATTLISQLAAYHLSASSHDDAAVEREPSTLSNFGFGLAPTDGGASLGLGFQF